MIHINPYEDRMAYLSGSIIVPCWHPYQSLSIHIFHWSPNFDPTSTERSPLSILKDVIDLYPAIKLEVAIEFQVLGKHAPKKRDRKRMRYPFYRILTDLTFLSFLGAIQTVDGDRIQPPESSCQPVPPDDPLQGRLESQLQEASMEGHLDFLR